MKKRIHILGASGSGTTSIGKAVCNKLGYKHFDSDNYLWLPTEKPFTAIRSSNEYINLMGKDLSANEKWVLSGHVSYGLGDVYLPLYELVVFMYVQHDIRMERLKKREHERYGDEILPSGSRYEHSKEFLDYCAGYDTGTGRRSLREHNKWLASIKCPVLKITNDSFEESVRILLEAIDT